MRDLGLLYVRTIILAWNTLTSPLLTEMWCMYLKVVTINTKLDRLVELQRLVLILLSVQLMLVG